MLGFFDDMTPGKAVVGLCAGAVMLTVWVLNAVFTFTYGVDIIGPFLLETQLGPDGSAMLSGLVALIFYDFSYTVAFMVLLFACRSNWQYAVIGIQFALCFIGSVMASAASIIILSPLGNEVPGMALIIARYLSYGGLIVIFVVNALATVGYIVTRPEMFAKIQESIHQASQTADTERFTKELRKKARMMAHDLVRDDLPDLAAQEAAAIRTNFVSGLPERASDGRTLNITQKEYQWKAPTPKAGKAVKEPSEPFTVWLCDETGRRVTKHGRTYSDFREADQTARRMSFGLAEGDKTAVYQGDREIVNYTAFRDGDNISSTADRTPTAYDSIPYPVRPTKNGRPTSPQRFDIWRRLPDSDEDEKFSRAASQDRAEEIVREDSKKRPPGTWYYISSGSKDLAIYERGTNDIKLWQPNGRASRHEAEAPVGPSETPEPNGRPTSPQRFE